MQNLISDCTTNARCNIVWPLPQKFNTAELRQFLIIIVLLLLLLR